MRNGLEQAVPTDRVSRSKHHRKVNNAAIVVVIGRLPIRKTITFRNRCPARGAKFRAQLDSAVLLVPVGELRVTQQQQISLSGCDDRSPTILIAAGPIERDGIGVQC